MDLQLRGKTAIVTGGSAGIGRAVTHALAAEGCRIAVVGRDLDKLTAITAELGAATIVPIAADLTQAEAADTVTGQAMAQFGVPDILVNCAGSSQGGLFWTLPDEVWDDSFALKVMGTIRMLRAVVPRMVERGSGRVVTVVGNGGRQPGARFLPGAAANAALLAITKGLADEVASAGVVINAVNPGPVRTDRWAKLMAKAAADAGTTIADVEGKALAAIPAGRLCEPEEVARYVVFLCSPLSAAATGTSLTIDGGATRAIA